MKALSIRQPWAWLIVNGYKDIENRTWTTKFKGKVLVHVSKTFNWADFNIVKTLDEKYINNYIDNIDSFDYGGIVGVVEIVDCVTEHKSKWFDGPFGFVLKNAKPLEFYSCKGRLGFFNVEYPGVV